MSDRPIELAYSAPPIIEALAQIYYEEPISDSDLKKAVSRIKKRYANQTKLKVSSAQLDMVNQGAQFKSMDQYKFSSEDETDIVTIDKHSFTWSKLAPYEGWQNIYDRIKNESEDINSVLPYRKANRLGLRYINRIDVPKIDDISRYEDYLTINISIPECWPSINNYGWRIEREFDKEFIAIVQSAVISPELPNTGAFLLDIDIVLGNSVPSKHADILKKFERMRSLKNEIFELSITDRARASFSS
ncbi:MULTISPECIES: TIGR04255 family protein [unclassified Sphingopyxis]|uniref:TIGR04255 family protein n=1 Tax=unclassified Sphingopyxis TaxID=2614943 RepID=UPI0024AD83BD|nr:MULTISPECIES: TIGR04255 family protein [unclassified Sphingopyxis]